MAAKGVNLLPEDDDSQEQNEPEEEFGDPLDDLSTRSRRKSGGGGGFLRILGILVALILLLGGVAWAGYQFWWIPRMEREQKIMEAKQRLEELRQKRLEQAKAERERREKELALLQKIQAEADGKAPNKPEKAVPAPRAQEKPVAPAFRPATPKEKAKKMTAEKKSPAASANKAQAKVAKEITREKAETKKMPEPVPKPPAMMMEAKKPEKKPAVQKSPPPVAPPSKPLSVAKAPEPPTTKSRMGAKPSPRHKAAPPRQQAANPPIASRNGYFYSVQVATCRTQGCVTAHAQKLREKGFRPFVSGRISPSAPWTEVLLDEFPTRRPAEALAAVAREKNFRVSVYASGKKWRVSAGSFANIEDAAQHLDKLEDAGLKGRLAAQPSKKKTQGYRVVRTGRLPTRRAALAMRKRIVSAGFADSFVVRQKSKR